MTNENETFRVKAALMLLLATFFWGTSFLTMKALVMVQQRDLPESNTWFLSALSLVFRFGVSAVILIIFNWQRLRKISRLEISEGAGLGIIGGIGLLFQMDGVNYTTASTSAFITQSYCLFIPVFVALRRKEWPSKTVALSSAMVLVGVALLIQLDFTAMKLGRGEWETVVASLFFTVQILWLERPVFSKNDGNNFTFVMFLVTALMFIPVCFYYGSFHQFTHVYQSGSSVVFSAMLAIFCTLIAYGLMNHWQRHVPATQAGLIYCSEPVFTTLFALFLPGIFSTLAKINYSNETMNSVQLMGGGLITAANILIFYQATRAARISAKPVS